MTKDKNHIPAQESQANEDFYLKIPFADLKTKLEALLFAADSPFELNDFKEIIPEASSFEIKMALKDLSREYDSHAFELSSNHGKYQLRVKDAHLPIVKKHHGVKPRNLSKSALETLAIIAYKQPVTKAQINAIRQVDCSSIMQNLKEKELIYASGVRKEVGNPLEYKTTEKFLEVFGIAQIENLPSLRSLQLNYADHKQAKSALEEIDKSVTNDEKIQPHDIGLKEVEKETSL